MATTKGSFEAAKASWGNPQLQSARRSRSPPTTAAHPSITVNPAAAAAAGVGDRSAAATPAAPAPATATNYAPATASTVRSKSPPLKERAAISPSPPVSPRNSRSFGADAYSVDYVKKTSNAVNLEVKDPNTECLRAVAESDVRCAIVTANGAVWIGERSGDISIRKQDGELAHIIERRKGAFVMCFAEVGATVWAGCSDGFIRVLSQTSFKMEAQFNRHSGSGSNVQTLAYHAPSNTVFSGSNDFQVLAWDATTCQFIRQLSGHSGGVRALAIDGNTLFSASDDTTIIAWDIATSQKVHQFTGHTKSVHCLAVTATHLWSGSEDATIRIWNPATGECIGIAEVHTGAVLTLQVIGDRVWSGAGDTVCMWDAVNLKLAGSATVHDGYVTNIVNICRTPRFKVWTTGSDQLVKLWTTESPDDLPVLRHRINSLLHVEHENRQLKDANRQLQERVVTLSETVKRLEDAVHIREQHVDDVSRKLIAADVEAAHLVPETVRLREELAIRDLRIRELEISNAELADRLPVHAVPAKVHLVDELSAARAEVAALSDRLRATIDSYEAKLANLAQTARAEEAARVTALLDEQHILQDTKLALRQDISRLTAEVERLYAELDHANAALKNTTALFEERVRELQAALADQKDRNAQLGAQNRKLEGDVNVLKDEVHARNTEIEKLQMKVRDMDNMFRSRLSLLTDFFGMYKKIDTLDKRARATPAPPASEISRELNALSANYKRVVATHYTDDELAHLGTSRHFFPITGAGVPTSPPPAKPAASGTALPPEANPSPRLARRPPSA